MKTFVLPRMVVYTIWYICFCHTVKYGSVHGRFYGHDLKKKKGDGRLGDFAMEMLDLEMVVQNSCRFEDQDRIHNATCLVSSHQGKVAVVLF